MSGTVAGGFTGRARRGPGGGGRELGGVVRRAGGDQPRGGGRAGVWLPQNAQARRQPDRHSRQARAGSLGDTSRNRQLIATYAVGFCILFTQVAMFTYVTFHLAAPPFSLSTVALGWLFVVYLVGAVVTPFGGRWIDRYGHRDGTRAGDGAWRAPAPC